MKEAEYRVHIDSPTQRKIRDRRIELEGWVFSRIKKEILTLQIRSGKIITPVRHGLLRSDVAEAFPDTDKKLTRRSGFRGDFEVVDPHTYLEADFGSGVEIIYEFDFELIDSAEDYNPFLATNLANHNDLMIVKKKYYFEEHSVISTETGVDKAPKAVAIYLPQFHPIEENNKAWGTGFTEWWNVATAKPRFVGHNQPFLPRDLGFYDLRLSTNLKDQIDLAKQHGIYGFYMYYYWFSGKKILNSPIDTLIAHPEWDFNFMICWANENWTKRWDGRDKEVIIAQEYRKSDPLDFIKDVELILTDPRYIRVNGKPVLAVYRCEHIKDPKNYAKIWRKYIREKYNLELQLISVMSFSDEDPLTYGFDAGLEFAPSNILRSNVADQKRLVNVSKSLIDSNFGGQVFDYRRFVLSTIHNEPKTKVTFPKYNCVMPSWDNDARKKGDNSYVFYYESPDLYKAWLDKALAEQTKQLPLTFINAWNEWAEGTTLEPTMHYGRALLNKTTQSLDQYSKPTRNALHTEAQKRTKRVAHLHADSEDGIKYVIAQVPVLESLGFDVNITAYRTQAIVLDVLDSNKAVPEVVPSRGRDILPFISALRRYREVGYTEVLKVYIHDAQDRKRYEKILKIIHKSQKERLAKKKPGDILILPDNTLEIITLSEETYSQLEEFYHSLYSNKYKLPPKLSTLDMGIFFADMTVLDRLNDAFVVPEDFVRHAPGTVDPLVETIGHLLCRGAEENEFTIATPNAIGGNLKITTTTGLREERVL